MLGDRPAILPRQVSQQPQDKRPNPSPRFDPPKPPRHPPEKLIQQCPPSARLYAVPYGHHKII